MSFTKPAAEKEKGVLVLVSLLTQYKENRMHQCKNIARGIVNSVRHLKNNRNTQEKNGLLPFKMGWMGKHNSTILVSFFTPVAFKNGLLSTLAWTCNTHIKFELTWLYQSCHFHFDHSNITVIFKTHWVARTGRDGKTPPGSSELVGMGKPHLGRQSWWGWV